jgi:hypothetical protein
MGEWSLDSREYRNQVALANHVPGPLNPPEYYYEPRTLECGHSEEDCDGRACGHRSDEVPADYDDFVGENHGLVGSMDGRQPR